MTTEKRVQFIRQGSTGSQTGAVVYWMSRDQRSRDNWALLYAQEQALRMKVPLHAVFCLVPEFLGATIRHYGFMLRGLEQTSEELRRKNISFSLLRGNPAAALPEFISRLGCSLLVSDFDPLRIKQQWKSAVARNIAVPFHEVDAHNIVPCWVTSSKLEYAAYTIRPKIRRLLPDFLVPFPRLKKHPYHDRKRTGQIDWRTVINGLPVDRTIGEVSWIVPGEKSALSLLRRFISKTLPSYSSLRNDPSASGQSNLSPYLHFGQISAQRVALEVSGSSAPKKEKDAFLEELIVRRELSDNFCYYNPRYDSVGAFPEWAKKTLDAHKSDRRHYRYRLADLEQSRTHDDLWNAAQREMVVRGKMHGYLRMYWAKKILEWTGSPEEALKTAIMLNDRYELDGRDPNGYAGIAWSIGGVHDRAWNERPIFGKIRYMSYGGCRSKFNVRNYIASVERQE